jgi:type III secretion protein F
MSFDNQRANPSTRNWDGEGPGGVADRWNGWLTEHSDRFDDGILDLKAELDRAYMELVGDGTPGNPGDPSNPTKLMAYPKALSEYNMYRMTQSNSVKNLADMQKQNARNLG